MTINQMYRKRMFFPKRIYANFSLTRSDYSRFTNEHYQDLLMFIGKHCYQTQNIRTICRMLKEEYNRTYHFNRLRHIKKKMSINQIEALSHSFTNRHIDDGVIVHIPFATVPIIYFILSKYHEIEVRNGDFGNNIDKMGIGAYLCAHQIKVMLLHLDKLLQQTSDEDYIYNCNSLNDDLVNHPHFMSLHWTEFCENSVDYVRQHWHME